MPNTSTSALLESCNTFPSRNISSCASENGTLTPIASSARIPHDARDPAVREVPVRRATLELHVGVELAKDGFRDVALEANCQSVVNPVLDTGKYLPHKVFPDNYGYYDDPKSVELYEAMQRETAQ